MLSRVSKLTSVKILFFRYFKKGKTIKDPTAAGRHCYRSTSHRSSRSDVSVLDLSISRTETLLRSTKTKRLKACFLQMEITELQQTWFSSMCRSTRRGKMVNAMFVGLLTVILVTSIAWKAGRCLALLEMVLLHIWALPRAYFARSPNMISIQRCTFKLLHLFKAQPTLQFKFL